MALTRPIAGQEVSAADFGQPMYDLVVPEPWTPATLVTGWANFAGGYAQVAYRKRGDMVDVRGTFQGAVGSGSNLFVLPAGYRPPTGVQVPLRATGGGDNYADIGINGNVNLRYTATGTVVMSLLFSFSVTP